MKRALFCAALACAGCRTIAPVVPRFVVIYEQDTGTCRLSVFRDTRSSACFVGLQCGRHGANFVAVPVEVCVP